MSFHGVRKFVDLLWAGGWLAFLAGLALVALDVIFESQSYHLTGGEFAIVAIGALAGLAFMKVSTLLVFYPLFYRSKFDGSLFVMAALDSALLVIALFAILYLKSTRTNELSTSDMWIMLGGAYVFFTLIFWAIAPVMHWILLGRRP